MINVVKSRLPNRPWGNGQGVKRGDTAHQKNLYIISKLPSLYYWTASVKLSVRKISLCPDCVTTGLAPDGVVNIDWESFTLWFQSLIAFQASSLFDGEVLAWSVVNTEIVFSVSHSLLIQLWSEVLSHFRSWLLYEMKYGKSDMINPWMCIPVRSFGCFPGHGCAFVLSQI